MLVLELLEELLAEELLLLALLVLLALKLLLELLELVELEEDVDVEFGEYKNVTTLEATAPFPPQVALTMNVPLVQAAFPPGCEV